MTAAVPATPRAAAFFDVDGTILRGTIVHYYIYFRSRRMNPLAARIWRAGYLTRCLYFLLLDKISRERLNIVFYRDYRGLCVDEIHGLVDDCYRDLMAARCFPPALECVAEHRRAGRPVVFVTGSVDFIMAPLARVLGADHVLAPALIAEHGRFTGALDGPPVSGAEKARRMRALAQRQHIDLAQSFAYGDSIADLAMLEAVGHANAVNPDRALARIAAQRGWPVHHWSTSAPVGDPQTC